MSGVAVITGASAGIGAELARVFARHGHPVVLVARREQKLRELAAEIAATGGVAPVVLALDLTQPDATSRLAAALTLRALEPEYIVNNAGYGLVGHAATLDRDEQLAMIDLNIRTLTDLSLAFVDALVRRRGGILNVASVAGFLPGPLSAVYYASKAYVLSLSEALHDELKGHGVRVTCVCPGPVATEFQARAGLPDDEAAWPVAVPAARVAELGYRGLMAGRRLVIPGAVNRVVAFMPRIAPRAILLRSLDRRQSRRLWKSARSK
jgi:short-subunit dehydrogenase